MSGHVFSSNIFKELASSAGHIKEVISINPTMQIIQNRRSVREFEQRPIPHEILTKIVDCGRMAPSARNIQPWHFVVITDTAILDSLAGLAPNGLFIKEAAACIAVCADGTSKYFLEDGVAATENILIAAKSLDIGSCWVAGHKKPYADDVRKLLGMPDGMELISLLALGYAATEPECPDKKPLSEILHWEKF
jgi:nitroreductase